MINKIAINVDIEIVRYCLVRGHMLISAFSNVMECGILDGETF